MSRAAAARLELVTSKPTPRAMQTPAAWDSGGVTGKPRATPLQRAELEVRLLGELTLLRGGRPVALPASKKTRALLAYLIATGRAHTRESLCDLLWEGPDDPRAALRWSLAKLRPLLDDGPALRLIADRERVAFEACGASIDLHELLALDADSARAGQPEQLERAAQLLRGELLDGLELPDCYRYSEWCRAQREHARRLMRALRTSRSKPTPLRRSTRWSTRARWSRPIRSTKRRTRA